ncbi:MAG: hypothetical protein Tsb0021_15490 [Chlamydiales bacterium]
MQFPSWSQAAEAKILLPERLSDCVKGVREKGKTIATLNGSFDLLHAGHLYIIHQAAQTAEILIVALNSDRSIQQYKSISRPIIPLKYRLEMMAALEFVDYVTWFEETDPRNLLEVIKPDVHVNGDSYGFDCIEAATVQKNGGRIHLVDLIPGLSTTAIVKKIRSLDDAF